ncbi:MAG: AMP-binding protein [Thermoleophilaceae bacterium]
MDVGIGRWISFWARVAPDHEAIVFGQDTITYAALDEQVNRMANALTGRAVRSGDRVAGLLGNRPELLVALFACAKLGALLVPLNVRLVPREIEFIVNDAGPRVLISESAFAPVLEGLKDDLGSVEAFVTLDPGGVGEPYAEFAATASAAPPDASGAGGELAICYTSGTTGVPKGAVLTNSSIIFGSLQEIVAYGLGHGDRHLLVVPLCFTGGLVTASMPIFHGGATMYLERAFDPSAVMERIGSERITHMMGVPTMFAAMAQMPGFANADFGSVELFLVGAAPVPAALVETYQSRGVTGFTNAYGLTEGTGFNLFLPASDVMDLPGAYLPAAYTDARVTDPDGNDVALGESGELTLSGPCVMEGYWRNEEATAETIRDGWLYTGDLVKLGENGYIYPVDRIKDMIISGGLNIYPAEVEGAIFGHPKLVESTVIGLPEEEWGEAVTIVAVAKPDEEVDLEELIEFCSDKLADYKRPKAVILVDELPRNAGGKVLKRDLREDFADHYRQAAGT